MLFPGFLRLGVAAAVVAFGALSTSCRRNGGDENEPAFGAANGNSRVEQGLREQILHFGNLSEPRDLDPHVITSLQDFNILLALFEGLTAYHPQTLEPVPGVAERWDVSPDGLVYTFHLRRDARWSNGDPVTAQDFLYSFRRILTPALGSEYPSMHYAVKNARKFYDGEVKDFAEAGYAALDAHTLQITLEQPTPYLPALLSHNAWLPVHPPTVEKHGGAALRGSRWTRPENFVGNGPFVLTTWRQHQIVEVRKSPTYWDAANVRLNGINFYPIESTDTEERAFRSGQLHVTTGTPISKIEIYRRDHPELIELEPQFATYIYRFNLRRKPLDDLRVRRALALAIDRETLVEKITRGGEKPAYHFTPPGTGGYTARARLEGDREEAKRLLAEAGFPGGAGFPRLELLYNTNDGHRLIAEAIQAMWRATLGVDITLHNQEAKVYEVTMRDGQYDIARYAWSGDYLDPNTFLEIMRTGNGNNQTGWSNPRYDELLTQANRTLDQAQRFELLHQAEEILIAEAPIAPIYFYTSKRLRLPMVKGWHHTVLDLHPYNRVYLER